MESIVELNNAGFTYPTGTRAVLNVNLTIPKGEITAIVGPSGCGKSSLLRMIAGLAEPTDGEVVKKLEPGRHPISMVFQTDTLLPWMKVRDNVSLHYKFSGAARQPGTIDYITTLMKIGGVHHFADAFP